MITIKRECIVCGEIQLVPESEIQCCCGHSMFPKHDLDLLRRAGWMKVRN